MKIDKFETLGLPACLPFRLRVLHPAEYNIWFMPHISHSTAV